MSGTLEAMAERAEIDGDDRAADAFRRAAWCIDALLREVHELCGYDRDDGEHLRHAPDEYCDLVATAEDSE